MIGVPAIWQLLQRKITQELAAKPAVVEQGIRGLLAAHAELRNRSSINLGKLLFWPIHRKFGGKMRFMVSGGSALPDQVQEAFHALGFNITQGYGLTEAAPVLTVEEARNQRQPGTVGKPLPGVELKIDNPDADGVGEVLAKGPNVMAGYFENREATEAVLQEGWLRTGDLGRLDSEGRLFLVGRKKDLILSANGKNVYPDELENLYFQHPYLKELSIVGLPDPIGGERVACLCVPDYKGRPKDEVRRELEEHFRKVSSELPFHRRVKVLRIWDGELPRTSTRKVKRSEVLSELQRLERAAASGERRRDAANSSESTGVSPWLYPLLSEVAQRSLGQIRPESQLVGDLGFDSLMLTELGVALEQAGVVLPAGADLSQVETVEELQKLIASVAPAGSRAKAPQPPDSEQKSEEIEIPEPVANLGRRLLSLGQRFLYGGVFDVRVSGKSFIPQNENFLVIANHTSHLDMGLIKVVLGDQGERLAALAARDYFFDTPLKRAYFENFTNLIPMDRHGSLRESLRIAGEALNQGCNLLIFPEGTRSPTGELLEFKPTLGFLALTYKVDVLPLYLGGTFEALPKGAIIPRAKDLAVRIGPVLRYVDLSQRTRGMARSESYRQVARLAEESIKALRDGRVMTLKGSPERIDLARHRKRPPSGAGGGVGHGIKRRR
jgi:long-chain acyl-CoA synthetase